MIADGVGSGASETELNEESRLVVCSDRQISREGSESSDASQIGELSELSISDPVGAVIQGQGRELRVIATYALEREEAKRRIGLSLDG
jgi:hypothetical protein